MTTALCALLAANFAAGASAAPRLKVLYTFCAEQFCPDGLNPVNGLLRDPQGNLYGETLEGGAHGVGTVFELYRPPGKTKYRFRVLHDFCSFSNECGEAGQGPGRGGHLIVDTSGNIYGVAGYGGAADSGLVFRLTPHKGGRPWSYRALYDLCAEANCADGVAPASLTYAGAASGVPYDGTSPLYGVAEFGGANNSGVAFSLTPPRKGPWTEQVLYDFCSQPNCADGVDPAQDLLLDAGGNLIGVANGGVTKDAGVVFKLSPQKGGGWSESVLHAFCPDANCADGRTPSGGLMQDAGGNLFGVTSFGGNPGCQAELGCGVLYKIAPDGSYSIVHSFCSENDCADGSQPSGRLTLDAAGNLLGTTVTGGALQDGIVYRLGRRLKVLHSFCNVCVDGTEPFDGVVLDPDGNILGTAGGGAHGLGVVFELKP
jgi:uncharacterized repeat protein (TIGR03803 family)